ncbi:MAG: SPOR domain-containing protein [Chitinophagales bacterium]|nr:SPOR domain-containing protein [Chitinophagales bacterium]
MKFFRILILVFSPILFFAQSNVSQSKEIAELVDNYREYQKAVDVQDGFRIQITYTSNRDEAYKAKAQLYREFDAVPSYIDYEQPNYKLRLGDFKTKLQATAFLQDVIKVYPGAFIVKDKIKNR